MACASSLVIGAGSAMLIGANDGARRNAKASAKACLCITHSRFCKEPWSYQRIRAKKGPAQTGPGVIAYVRHWHKVHAQCADECPLLGAKRTVTNRCLPTSIYEWFRNPKHFAVAMV